MTDLSNSSVDDILDMELDDLEDMPEFKPFPVGVHKCIVSMEIKEVNDKQAVEVELKAIESMELANPADEPLKADDSTNILCFLDNEFGRANLKEIAAYFKEYAGSGTTRAIIDAVSNVECLVVTGQRYSKKTESTYTTIKELQVI